MTNQRQKHYDKTNMVESIADCFVQDHICLMNECESLRQKLAAAHENVRIANSQAEEFERKWYLANDALENSQKREVMLRQELLYYGEHEGSCSIVDIDADGFQCECDCGLAAILAATADLENVRLCEKEPVGAVLVDRESREGVMFYSGDMLPDMTTIKAKFELIRVYEAWEPK